MEFYYSPQKIWPALGFPSSPSQRQGYLWLFLPLVKWSDVNLISRLTLVSRLSVNGAVRPLRLLLLSRIEGEICLLLSLYFVATGQCCQYCAVQRHCMYRHSPTSRSGKKNHWNNNICETCAEFFFTRVKAQWDECYTTDSYIYSCVLFPKLVAANHWPFEY